MCLGLVCAGSTCTRRVGPRLPLLLLLLLAGPCALVAVVVAGCSWQR